MAPLTGKLAFVTGSSRGIGAAIVRHHESLRQVTGAALFLASDAPAWISGRIIDVDRRRRDGLTPVLQACQVAQQVHGARVAGERPHLEPDGYA